jgi:hypothetical protein
MKEPRGAQAIQASGTVQSAPGAQEPCVICGHETAIGSRLHPTRRSFSDVDGRDIFLCADCEEAARATRGGESLSDDDLRTFVRNASLAGVAWSNG